jgi:DNA-binding MarR family transcriptional regulator
MKDSSIKISINLQSTQYDIQTLLDSIFWKEKDVVPNSLELLTYIRDWSNTSSPHQARDWKKYCQKTKITQSQYHTILKRLRKAGLIEKKYNKELRTHTIKTTNKFPETLTKLAETYTKFSQTTGTKEF